MFLRPKFQIIPLVFVLVNILLLLMQSHFYALIPLKSPRHTVMWLGHSPKNGRKLVAIFEHFLAAHVSKELEWKQANNSQAVPVSFFLGISRLANFLLFKSTLPIEGPSLPHRPGQLALLQGEGGREGGTLTHPPDGRGQEGEGEETRRKHFAHLT